MAGEVLVTPFPRLYAIIDPAQTDVRPLAKVAELLLSAGIRVIHVRDKHASSGELFQESRQIVDQGRRSNVIVIVNDRADVARAADAHGVHLGQRDLPADSARRILSPGQWVGLSTHTVQQVIDADRSSADYIAFGPIFTTSSKAQPDPVVGLAGLREARKATAKPLVAIGGITTENSRAVIDSGADSVAVIGGLLGAPDPRQRAEEFLRILSG
jgi:thiamine-phosphate pyrophosphorylase